MLLSINHTVGKYMYMYVLLDRRKLWHFKFILAFGNLVQQNFYLCLFLFGFWCDFGKIVINKNVKGEE